MTNNIDLLITFTTLNYYIGLVLDSLPYSRVMEPYLFIWKS